MDSKQRAAETIEQRAEEIVEYIAVNEWDDRKVLALILAALRVEREACAQIADGLWNGHIAAAIRGRE